jgi:hypothetical protein
MVASVRPVSFARRGVISPTAARDAVYALPEGRAATVAEGFFRLTVTCAL